MTLSWLQPTYSSSATGNVPRRDSEHIIDTGKGNPIGIVIQLCIAISIFC